MSAPVDVLAVMDEFISIYSVAEECSDDTLFLRDAAEARAAVAELIEAAHPFQTDPNPLGNGNHYTSALCVRLGDVRRMKAALTRVKGGAA